MANPALGRWGGLIVLIVVVAALPLVLPNKFYYDIAVKTGLNALVCVGLNLLIGYAGQISLGHAAFFALGGYASAVLTTRYEWNGFLALGAGAVATGIVAYLVARPILRLKGHYLAMATLAFGIIVSLVLNREIWLTGGPDGITVPTLRLGDMRLRSAETWYWITGGALVVVTYLALNLIHSPSGRAIRALHGSEVAAETLGIDVARTKTMVFVLSAVIAAIAGSLFAHADRFITPNEAGFLRSVELVTMVVLGGMASTFGAIVGAALLTVLPQALAGFDEFKHIVLGAILVGTMIFLPKGLVPSLGALIRRWRR
ncbi:MAG: branched-chain amino acid ABC transporter permease [Alphaproteobacteria bacterium]|jgi:branched-chain amino acid transport system permease protein|nr:branched-chain amino acid ABC transporter permease [Alphaproteobacteria bacterium]